MVNANGKLATQNRLDSHDLIIDMIGLYWVKHIFGIYSAYIQHILEPEGNHEENKWTAGGSKAVGQRLTRLRN